MLNGEWHICRLFCIYKGLFSSETCALYEERILRTPVQNHDAPPMNILNCDWLHFCHTCSLCRVELVVQFLARSSTQVLLCLFPGVLWMWHFLYSVSLHPVSSLHIYFFVESRAFMAGVASQAGDADSSRTPGLTSGLQGSVNVHRGVLLLVPQWQCISSFVFNIDENPIPLRFFFVFLCLILTKHSKELF